MSPLWGAMGLGGRLRPKSRVCVAPHFRTLRASGAEGGEGTGRGAARRLSEWRGSVDTFVNGGRASDWKRLDSSFEYDILCPNDERIIRKSMRIVDLIIVCHD